MRKFFGDSTGGVHVVPEPPREDASAEHWQRGYDTGWWVGVGTVLAALAVMYGLHLLGLPTPFRWLR